MKQGILISLIRSSFHESRNDWLSQIIRNYELDINYFEQTEWQDGTYVTPIDYLKRVAGNARTENPSEYDKLNKWIATLRKNGAKYCWEIPECPQK